MEIIHLDRGHAVVLDGQAERLPDSGMVWFDFAYFMALGGMVLLGVGLLAIFRFKRWV